uniref:Uncharacterized protein n=1 Tax=Sipha flava TaxID=143950 RepID=A0A2S2QD42_9HEMI
MMMIVTATEHDNNDDTALRLLAEQTRALIGGNETFCTINNNTNISLSGKRNARIVGYIRNSETCVSSAVTTSGGVGRRVNERKVTAGRSANGRLRSRRWRPAATGHVQKETKQRSVRETRRRERRLTRESE